MAQPGTGRIRRRRVGVLGLAGAVLVAVTGCAAGQIASSANQTPAVDGVAVNVGSMNVRAAAVVAPSQASYPQGGGAPLQLVLVNSGQQTDTLTRITTDVASGVSFYPTFGAIPSAADSSAPAASSASAPPATTLSGITVQPGERVSIGFADTDKAILLTGLTKALFPAQSFRITFGFANAGSGTFAIAVHLGAAPSNRPTVDVSPTVEP